MVSQSKLEKSKFVLTGVFLKIKEKNNEEKITAIEEDFDDLYTTSINDIIKEKSKSYITYIDPNKSRIKLWCNMYDITLQIFLPLSTDLPCWWCRDSFKTPPLGLPLFYHVENARNKNRFQALIKSRNLPPDIKDFFETEGIFCSFPCCKKYIIEGGVRYKNSSTLLTLLYLLIYGVIVNIEPADTWKVLKRWGGHLTIEEYRSSFGKIEYVMTPNIKRPFMISTGSYIEEIVK